MEAWKVAFARLRRVGAGRSIRKFWCSQHIGKECIGNRCCSLKAYV